MWCIYDERNKLFAAFSRKVDADVCMETYGKQTWKCERIRGVLVLAEKD